jgi:hypothetical protein
MSDKNTAQGKSLPPIPKKLGKAINLIGVYILLVVIVLLQIVSFLGILSPKPGQDIPTDIPVTISPEATLGEPIASSTPVVGKYDAKFVEIFNPLLNLNTLTGGYRGVLVIEVTERETKKLAGDTIFRILSSPNVQGISGEYMTAADGRIRLEFGVPSGDVEQLELTLTYELSNEVTPGIDGYSGITRNEIILPSLPVNLFQPYDASIMIDKSEVFALIGDDLLLRLPKDLQVRVLAESSDGSYRFIGVKGYVKNEILFEDPTAINALVKVDLNTALYLLKEDGSKDGSNYLPFLKESMLPAIQESSDQGYSLVSIFGRVLAGNLQP